MKVTANGKTFTFPDGTSTEDIGAAIDEYFSGQASAVETQPAEQQTEPSLMQRAGDFLTGGQGAGQIAEQAGRGLVNIPFDVLQGGASLINAISQGLGGPKVLDDVYRPVDRPTDPYAQAGRLLVGILSLGLEWRVIWLSGQSLRPLISKVILLAMLQRMPPSTLGHKGLYRLLQKG